MSFLSPKPKRPKIEQPDVPQVDEARDAAQEEARRNRRRGRRAYILTGDSGLADTGNVGGKTVLGA